MCSLVVSLAVQEAGIILLSFGMAALLDRVVDAARVAQDYLLLRLIQVGQDLRLAIIGIGSDLLRHLKDAVILAQVHVLSKALQLWVGSFIHYSCLNKMIISVWLAQTLVQGGGVQVRHR